MPAPHPRMHGRVHTHGGPDPIQIAYEATGEPGEGGGIMFEILNVGAWLDIQTTGLEAGLYGIRLIADLGTFQINAADEDVEIGAGRDVNLDAVHDIQINAGRDVGVTSVRHIALNATQDLELRATSGNIYLVSLPTSDPAVTGALWNDGGTVKIS